MTFNATANLLISYFIAFVSLYLVVFLLIVFFRKKTQFTEQKKHAIFKPGISVIIPAFNEEATIAETIKSVLNSNYPKSKLEIIVVDDGSTDKTFAVAKKFVSKNVKVFRKENTGKADSLNFGIAKTKGEIIATLDADSYVEKETIGKMLPYFNEHGVMAVTSAIKVFNKQNFLGKMQHLEYLYTIFTRKLMSLIDAVYVTPGPFSMFRREVFEKLGGFEKGNVMEDQEIALRMQLHNMKIRSSLDAEVYTNAPHTFKGLLKQRVRWNRGGIRNVFRYRKLVAVEYGDLGLFVMPLALLSVAFIALIIILALSNFLEEAIYARALGFELLPLVLIDPINIIAFAILIFTIAGVFVGLKVIKGERVTPIVLFLYIFVYAWLITIFWLVTIYKELRRAKLRW